MSEFSLLVQEYYKNPVNNYQMKDCDFFRHEGNSICEDDINVYIQYTSRENSQQKCDINKHFSKQLQNNTGDMTDINHNPYNQLLPEDYIVTNWSFDGNVSMITQAASSFFSELVVGHTFAEILSRDETIMIENGFDVSPRRRRARVIALLATRNAIHDFFKDCKEDTFEDILV